MFITFEGIEGSGKSTQLARLAAALRQRGEKITTTREPGGSPAGELVRRILTDPATPPMSGRTELFLYLADRANHVEQTIGPALEAGHVVLCDRFSDSTLAYQGFGRGEDLALIRRLDAVARRDLSPSLTFLLDCPVAIGLERARRRPPTATPEDRFEREPVALHERIRAGFLELARAESDRFVVLDGRRSVSDNASRVLDETTKRLRARRAARS